MATRTKPGSQHCRKPDPGSIEMLCREGVKRNALHSLASCALLAGRPRRRSNADLLVDCAVRSGDFQTGIAQRPVVPAACSETTRRQSRSTRADVFRSGRANPATGAEVGARRRGDRDDNRVAFIHGLSTNRIAGYKLGDTLAGRRLEGSSPIG
jgi:hypothetical protein